MRRRATFGVSVGMAMLLAGCGTATVAAPVLEDNGPDRPGAGGAELVVAPQHLDAPWVLDPMPADLRLTEFSYNPPPSAYPPARTTLYGDPAFPDTLDGPVLLVGSSSGSAVRGGPPNSSEGPRDVDIGDGTGFLVHDGNTTWVALPGGDNDYVAFVVGRGLSDEQLIEAARAADVSTDAATIAASAIPAGLEPLIISSPRDGPYLAVGERLRLASDSATIYVSAVKADPRLAALWGFWADDPGGTMVRGQPGSVGEMHGIGLGDGARGRVWAENGLVLSVVAYGGSDELVDRVVDSLRVGTAAELDAMRLGSITREPKPSEVGCPEGAVLVSAIVDDYRWAFGVGVDPDYPDEGAQSCSALITVDPSDGAGSGSFALAPLGRLSGETSWTDGPPGHPAGTTLGGVAPPGTDRVTILGPDGVSVDAVLSVDGLRPGERLFGQFFPGPSAGVDGPYAITALDAAGMTLATLAL